MDSFYINTAKECFLKAHIVIDHYHVVSHALRALDSFRLLIQRTDKIKLPLSKKALHKTYYELTELETQKLKECFQMSDDFRKMWLIVNEIRKIYHQSNWKQANSQFRFVLKLCRDSNLPQANDLAKTLTRWREEILNYYISKTTNAFTEGTHTKFERIKRNHCGIKNVERFAKRLIFCALPFSTITDIFAQFV